MQRSFVYISPRLLSSVSFILFAKCWCVFPVNKVLLSWYSYQHESIWTWPWYCDLTADVVALVTLISCKAREVPGRGLPLASCPSSQHLVFLFVSRSYAVSSSRPVVSVSLELDAKEPLHAGLRGALRAGVPQMWSWLSAAHVPFLWGCPSSLG